MPDTEAGRKRQNWGERVSLHMKRFESDRCKGRIGNATSEARHAIVSPALYFHQLACIVARQSGNKPDRYLP